MSLASDIKASQVVGPPLFPTMMQSKLLAVSFSAHVQVVHQFRFTLPTSVRKRLDVDAMQMLANAWSMDQIHIHFLGRPEVSVETTVVEQHTDGLRFGIERQSAHIGAFDCVRPIKNFHDSALSHNRSEKQRGHDAYTLTISMIIMRSG